MREVSLAVLDIAQNSVDAGAKLIEISVEIRKDGLTFEVRDDGVGMDGDTLAVCAQKDVSFKGSTGLGLALLKEETESTGGKVTVNSEKYVGTAV
ncbi:MAG: ATP-binding protein, partial [Clostridia bacterium]|nr:ATP-binding protein [Clostridia bacterium]